MCDPISIIAATAATASTGAQIYGQYKSNKAQQAAIESQRKANDYNARILERNADQIEAQIGDVAVAGKEALTQYGRKVNEFKGAQRSSAAASGVVVDTGSVADIVYDTDRMAGEDALTIRRNIAKEVEAYKNEQQNLRDQANLLRNTDYGTVSPYSGMGTSILTGASNLTDKFLNLGNIRGWWK